MSSCTCDFGVMVGPAVMAVDWASCICPTPRLHAVFPEGPEAVEPCEEATPASAFLNARCDLCGGRYDGPWRRIPAGLAGR
ncbi:hypothetical protein ABTX82_37855 [Streptomyces lavendulae]|uniref:hypothetical protein n=1 Tax=Streptomyces lavendulae TaxID=1914 RepID=UPI00332D383E